MKIFVAREPEKPLVVPRDARLARLQEVVAPEDQARRRAMLEPPVTVPDRESQERIARKGRRSPEELDLRLAELAQILCDTIEIGAGTACEDEPVRYAGRLELDDIESTDLERMIN
jgi:hypothetical protein